MRLATCLSVSTALIAAPTVVEAKDISGLTVGMAVSTAREILSREGELKEEQSGPVTAVEAGRYSVLGCNGKVGMVIHERGWEFRFFASLGQWAIEQYGSPSRTEVVSVPDNENAIRLHWEEPTGSHYSISYYQSLAGGPGQVLEALIGTDGKACLETTNFDPDD